MIFTEILFALLFGLSGIALGIWSIKRSDFISQGKITLRTKIYNSILIGLSGSLLFESIIIIISLFDEGYNWSTKGILGSIFISGIVGLIIVVGSFIQTLAVEKYREELLDWLVKRK